MSREDKRVIVLDFDDAIFPTTAHQKDPSFINNPKFNDYIKSIKSFTNKLRELKNTDIWICTLGTPEWVSHALNILKINFLADLFKNRKIVYARKFDKETKSMRKMKCLGFQYIISQYKDRKVQILSIGDDLERDKIQFWKAVKNHPSILPKFILFKPSPKLEELIKELDIMTAQIEEVLDIEEGFDIDIF